MSIHVHALTGCSPDPLAHYLKAIGILRLLSEQKDDQARGWWHREVFRLATSLERDQLVCFFCEEYEPTPIVAPWNGGSGFYPRDAHAGIDAISASQASRFKRYRRVIEDARAVVAGREKSPKGAEKTAVLRALRHGWTQRDLAWFDAAIVLDAEGEPAYPSLLGTGGNDGRLDFTNNFMQRLVDLFDAQHAHAAARGDAEELLDSALFGTPWSGSEKNAVGQFLPGGAGGTNNTSGYSSDSLVNAWDYVLMLEGAVAFKASVARNLARRQMPHAAAPFAVESANAGYGSASAGEKDRGEQWFPLWSRPASLIELEQVITEGRSRVGRASASTPTDFGRAIARLGVARGLSGFQRFGYIERNGQANLAVSLGRWSVEAQPNAHLLDEIAAWVDRLRRVAASDLAPASVARSARMCEEAMLGVCRDGANSRRWRDLVIALGAAEEALARSPRFTAERRLRPLPRLRPAWLNAAAADLPEFRLAVALAAQHGLNDRGGLDRRDSVRRHFLPLDAGGRGFASSGDSLQQLGDLVCTSGAAEKDLISLVRRRLQEAGRKGLPRLPLAPVPGAEAGGHDIAAWLDGEVDDGLVIGLARGFMAIDWPRKIELSLPHPAVRRFLGPAGLFHLAYQPYEVPLDGGASVAVPLDSTPLTRLAAGELQRATESVVRRLSSAGLRPHVNSIVGSPALARRIASSLAFPLERSTIRRLAERLTHPTLKMDEPDAAADAVPLKQEA